MGELLFYLDGLQIKTKSCFERTTNAEKVYIC